MKKKVHETNLANFFLKENYDTRQKKKYHQMCKAHVMRLVIIIVLSRARPAIVICDSKKKKKKEKKRGRSERSSKL